MGGSQEILQEYLVKLGYKTDLISLRKFEDGLSNTGKRLFSLGGKVAGVVASVEAASAAFAYSMRKTYFGAELANTSVKSMNAMIFAGKQFGITGDQMGSAIKGMAQAMRLNPGLQSLVESFGIKVQGRDTADVMMDFVKSLKDMPEFVGQQYASLFGIDPDTYHQMITHYDELEKKRAQLLNQYKNAGIDPDAAKAVVLEYTGALDELESKLSMLGIALMTKFLPQFKNFTVTLNSAADWWIGWARGINTVGDALDGISAKSVWGFLKDTFGGESENDKKVREMLGAPKTGGAAPGGKAAGTGARSNAPRNQRNNNPGNIEYGSFAISQGATGSDGRFAIFPTMEAGYAAQQALLQSYGKKGINTIEGIVSRWAPSHENNTGAYTGYLSKRMGVGKGQELNMSDPATLVAISKGLSRYEGMPESALGAADRTRLGMSAANVVSQTNNTTINVQGQGAEATGRAVASAQSRVVADGVRQLKGATG